MIAWLQVVGMKVGTMPLPYAARDASRPAAVLPVVPTAFAKGTLCTAEVCAVCCVLRAASSTAIFEDGCGVNTAVGCGHRDSAMRCVPTQTRALLRVGLTR